MKKSIIILLASGAFAVQNAHAGFDEGVAALKKNDFAKAFVEFENCSTEAKCQYNLGTMFDDGVGVAKSDTEAVKWYRLAADQGHASAQSNLGVMYQNGKGVAKSDTEAVKWYRLAADQGHASAQYNLGVMYYSSQGVAQSYTEAVKWFHLAADQGHAKAQHNLGVMYEEGYGVVRDYAVATYWLAKAAQQGYVKSIDSLYFLKPLLKTLTIKSNSPLFERASEYSNKLVILTKGETVYELVEFDGFTSVYVPNGHQVGYIFSKPLAAVNNKSSQLESSPFPPKPAAKPGVTVCSTECYNAQCYRTYSDGRQVQFTAKQVWDPFNNTFKFDSGGC